jgi:hypothetical protein
MLRLTAAVLLLLALPVRANLGDTVAGCVKRYGVPDPVVGAKSPTDALVASVGPFQAISFSAGPYQMIIFLYHNVEVGARVTRKDKAALSPAEMKTIMDADAPTPWVPKPSDDPTSQEWTREDKASVSYDVEKRMLIFTTPEMVQELHAPPPAPVLPAAGAPPRPTGNFAPAAPTPWSAPQPPSTNAAPATNAP